MGFVDTRRRYLDARNEFAAQAHVRRTSVKKFSCGAATRRTIEKRA
jgi:hypothetical protein